MMEKLHINMTFNLIQQIRLVHALTESKYSISIPTEEKFKFNAIKEYFGIQFVSNDSQSVDISSCLNISHADPLTSIGQIVRPLIFPHSIAIYCRSLWEDRRKHRYSFQGLITDKRKKLLEDWIEDKLNKKVCLSSQQNILSKLKTKTFSRIGIDTTRRRNLGELLLWESDRGRKFPIKAWDDDYFRVLANSEFVLCPSGDYIWSYRFFESVLCGAIPIVEKDCSVYNGFRFLSFQDEVTQLEWSVEDAEYNYKACVERLTIPDVTLNDEIADILKSKKIS